MCVCVCVCCSQFHQSPNSRPEVDVLGYKTLDKDSGHLITVVERSPFTDLQIIVFDFENVWYIR